jgi:hypothetical protein
MQEEEAKEAGTLGYIGRCVVQATLPHSDPAPEHSFERQNGTYVLSIVAPKKTGLPFGVYPRLILIWMSGEVVRTEEPKLWLGDRLAEFMRAIGITPTGGRHGTITNLRDQMKRLFSSSIDFSSEEGHRDRGSGCRIADDYELWWKPKQPDQSDLWRSWVELSPKFFAELKNFSIPIDLRRVKMLRRSPLALDIYTWWTYRFSYLRKQTEVPWEALYLQFGASYGTIRQFRWEFKRAVKKAHAAYPEANISEGKYGLILRPSRTSIPKLLPQPSIATQERAENWTKRHQSKYHKFLHELERMKQASVGVRISDENAELIRRAQVASDRAGIPLDIAYRVLGLEKLT